MRLANSPTCVKCLEEDETVEHFLCRCPIFSRVRRRILGDFELRSEELISADLKSVLSFIKSTRRFREVTQLECPQVLYSKKIVKRTLEYSLVEYFFKSYLFSASTKMVQQMQMMIYSVSLRDLVNLVQAPSKQPIRPVDSSFCIIYFTVVLKCSIAQITYQKYKKI